MAEQMRTQSCCKSCGKPWAQHDGIQKLCDEQQKVLRFVVEMLASTDSHENGASFYRCTATGGALERLKWGFEMRVNPDLLEFVDANQFADDIVKRMSEDIRQAVIHRLQNRTPKP